MALKLYNTFTRKKEAFKPQKDAGNVVTLYTCGPTVYDYAHIGNFRTYVFEDILRRTIESHGCKVRQAMNLTDVDDKTIRRSMEEGIPLALYTEKYKKAFFDDLTALNIERAEAYPEATMHVQEMIALIELLLDKGFAYMGEDKSVYFSIKHLKTYGRLSRIRLSDLKAGARVKQDEYEKEDASDFALWKAWDADDGDVAWESPFGRGRPGWHIECSAMSMKHLGHAFDHGRFDPEGFRTIDLHTGGVDNKFPHHEDEIAQSEAATGKPFVRTWLHAEHLIVDGKKMSKSLGNYYTVRDLIGKGHDPKALRYALLSTHYRAQLNFTLTGLDAARQAVGRLQEFTRKVMDACGRKAGIAKDITVAEKAFFSAMDDDLNTPLALAALFSFVKDMNILMDQGTIDKGEAQRILAFLKKADAILGVLSFERGTIDAEVERLIAEREGARARKDFAKADAIRTELEKKGILLDDTPQGVRWKRK